MVPHCLCLQLRTAPCILNYTRYTHINVYIFIRTYTFIIISEAYILYQHVTRCFIFLYLHVIGRFIFDIYKSSEVSYFIFTCHHGETM